MASPGECSTSSSGMVLLLGHLLVFTILSRFKVKQDLLKEFSAKQLDVGVMNSREKEMGFKRKNRGSRVLNFDIYWSLRNRQALLTLLPALFYLSSYLN